MKLRLSRDVRALCERLNRLASIYLEVLHRFVQNFIKMRDINQDVIGLKILNDFFDSRLVRIFEQYNELLTTCIRSKIYS